MAEMNCDCETKVYLEIDKMLTEVKKDCCADHVVKALLAAACCIAMDHYPLDGSYRDYLRILVENTCDEIEEAVDEA